MLMRAEMPVHDRALHRYTALYERNARLIGLDAGDPELVTAKAKRVILTESDAFLAKYLRTH